MPARSARLAARPAPSCASQAAMASQPCRPVAVPQARLAAAIASQQVEVERSRIPAAIASSTSPSGRPKPCRRRASMPLARAEPGHRRRARRAQALRKRSAPLSPSLRLSVCRSRIRPRSPSLSARTSRSARVARASNCCSRPSSGRKPGASPASDGKAASRLWAKAWMVWTRRPPPGASRTRANRVRARARVSGPGSSPSIVSSWPRSASFEPHPISEPAVDPPRHLGRAGLGEGQAEDRGRIDAGKQQPQHPRGQDMGLAGPRRRRQRGMVARMRGAELVAFEQGERAEAVGHRTPRLAPSGPPRHPRRTLRKSTPRR